MPDKLTTTPHNIDSIQQRQGFGSLKPPPLLNRINEMRIGDDSPEKAGVGGSIPSLATILSIT